ncbi:hypothetical protein [Isachenkonia alkalipeptolytica]|uniref:CsbD family protein n=1 Tax=Isachenkonia alkalipeptolytica TaxID=2565777 RepID=A0AA43XLE4_9CLOT|nr:hypothetical protein [Isachenkonia alkalipeptolytica]NBG88461.1 hypothetical protein [Isachenkonia alkalipeptolytica]
MSNKQPDSNWEEFKSKIKKIWQDLSDEELNEFEGDKDKTYEQIGKKYGLSREEIDKRMDEYDI